MIHQIHGQQKSCYSVVVSYISLVVALFISAGELLVKPCLGQLQAGVYDFGQSRFGEKRGSWTPGEWLALILLLMTIGLGLALSIGLCYYVNRRQAQKSTSRLNYLKRQQLQVVGIPVPIVHEQDRDHKQAEEASKAQTLMSARDSSGRSDLGRKMTRAGQVTDTPSYYQDYYNGQRRYQQQTPDPSLVVQI